jgi:PadR family transcriptional regulator, regulatory protein PadR
MHGMEDRLAISELRRGVLGACVLAVLEDEPCFGLELVRQLSRADGLLTSQGTVYPLLTRLEQGGWVSSNWHAGSGQRPRRYYTITKSGRAALDAFRSDWEKFSHSVSEVLLPPATPSVTSRVGRA